MSSSPPGASPTNMSSASGFPTPKTICLRPSRCSLQRVQSPISSRTATRASAEVTDGFAGSAVPRFALGVSVRVRHRTSRLTPMTPSSLANVRCSMSWSRFIVGQKNGSLRRLYYLRATGAASGQKLLNTIEDDGCNLGLAPERNRLHAVRANDRDLVRVDPKPGIRSGDIVGNDQIEGLCRALGSGMRDDLFRFSSKTDQEWAISRCGTAPAEIGEDVGRLPEHKRECVTAFRHLLDCRFGRRVI